MSVPTSATTSGSRPFAVVTGASSGIGFELAKLFGEHGYDLLICAEDAELDAAAVRLRASGASVDAVRLDLREFNDVEKLWSVVTGTGRPVEAIALNAGIGGGGSFVDQRPRRRPLDRAAQRRVDRSSRQAGTG